MKDTDCTLGPPSKIDRIICTAFSLVKVHSRDAAGFRRPAIRIKNIVTDNLSQGKKLNPNVTKKEIKQYRNDVISQVNAQGQLEGVFAELPKQRLHVPKH
jgi:hypothetical protein